jgi:hypothetical protein
LLFKTISEMFLYYFKVPQEYTLYPCPMRSFPRWI